MKNEEITIIEDEEFKKHYDRTYKSGNTIIHVVSPERTLGRKMTQEEINNVLKDIAKVNREMLIKQKIAEMDK